MFPCVGCGASIEFAPGVAALQCPYCGRQQQIQAPVRPVMEHSFAALSARPRVLANQLTAYHFTCEKCGASTQSDALAQRCQFCAAPLVVSPGEDLLIPPEAILPFGFDRQVARDVLGKWVKSRWFAPNRLKRVADAESMRSTYLPYWTYDSETVTWYRGERGTHYYTTESYTDSEGKTQTRQVQHTSWSSVQGTVWRRFDDVLVSATTRHVPAERLGKLAPWPLQYAVAYDPSFAAGHHALRYDVEPEPGFEQARGEMARVIEGDCRRDIGGDEQRVHSMNTQHGNVTFKHLLLPVWVGAYLYGGKTYQVLINGISREIHGDRPYSTAKILLAIFVSLALVVALVLLYTNYS